MLKGLAITPPVIGRISIGRVVERNGKRLPEKDDQFTLTSQVQNREGWLLHPMDEALRKEAGGKLRSIPVRLVFDDPALNLRADYSLFDRTTGRPVCVGNGETSRRVGNEGVTQQPCPGPEVCPFANGDCKAYARFNVIVGNGEEDALGSFVLRTTSFNTIRTLAARLQYFNAVSGGRLACMPLELKLRGKSTAMSFRTAIYYVDIVVRTGLTLEQAIQEARDLDQRRQASGFEQAALDEAARQGYANGAFEELGEDGSAVLEEFYPECGATPEAEVSQRTLSTSLRGKLERNVTRITSEQDTTLSHQVKPAGARNDARRKQCSS